MVQGISNATAPNAMDPPTSVLQNLTLIRSDDSCLSGNFSSVSYSIDGCGRVSAPPQLKYTNAAVLFEYSFDSTGCDNVSPSAASTGDPSGTSLAIIVGASVAGVVALLIIVVLVVMLIPGARAKVFPFRGRGKRDPLGDD